MALNFQISFYRNKESLYIKLDGDFDGSSAHELLNALLEKGPDFKHIRIDTNDLKKIYPFGRNVFEKNFRPLRKQLNNIIFAGENKHYIVPGLTQSWDLMIISVILTALIIYMAIVVYLYQKTEMPDIPDWEEECWK